MSLTADDFWAAYHHASNCAGKAVQLRRVLETKGDLLRLLDELAIDELAQVGEAVDAVKSYLVPSIPSVATFGPVMAASWHHAVFNCLGDMLRDIMNIAGSPPEVGWFDGSIDEEQRNRELLKVGDHLVTIRDYLLKRYRGLEEELKLARCMLYKEMAIAWQAYCWESAMGINPEPPPAAPGTAVMTSHGPDFRSVIWSSKPYSFTKKQAAAVEILWTAWEQNTPEVGEEHILKSIGADEPELRDVFRNHKAWGVMVVAGTGGAFRLDD